mmetsp:Transcript_63703/g.170633  ORF Transcript_63703/g.170633 Transcript_63703/m.170633 type:complete len:230 (+) Transcript_63703:890-1579(+)
MRATYQLEGRRQRGGRGAPLPALARGGGGPPGHRGPAHRLQGGDRRHRRSEPDRPHRSLPVPTPRRGPPAARAQGRPKRRRLQLVHRADLGRRPLHRQGYPGRRAGAGGGHRRARVAPQGPGGPELGNVHRKSDIVIIGLSRNSQGQMHVRAHARALTIAVHPFFILGIVTKLRRGRSQPVRRSSNSSEIVRDVREQAGAPIQRCAHCNPRLTARPSQHLPAARCRTAG